jgi:hypothetical protein
MSPNPNGKQKSIRQKKSEQKKSEQKNIISSDLPNSNTVISIEDKILRTGDVAKIKLEFILKPEYIKSKMKLIFREGKVKAVGKIIKNQII